MDHFDGTANYSRQQHIGTDRYDEKYWSSLHDVRDR
jgi:hypothetical protein